MEKLTQCQKILRHIKDYGSINPHEAFSHYGIMRLASRITDLKHQGYDIKVEMRTGVNRYQEPVRFAVYTIRNL